MSSVANGQPLPRGQTDVLGKSANDSTVNMSNNISSFGVHTTPQSIFTGAKLAPRELPDTKPSSPDGTQSPHRKDITVAVYESDSPAKRSDASDLNAKLNVGVITAAGASNGASCIYWEKLRVLLEEAHLVSKSLLPNALLLPVEHLGPRGEFALLMQGRSPVECEAHLSNLPSSQAVVFRNLLDSCAAGSFTDYGVENDHISWVADYFLRIINQSGNSIETFQDWARVRVFEAEVVCLPMESIDALLAARKTMRNLRARIDKCVRIIASMEGRGRRKTQSALDKLKAALEKAEIQARTEQSRAQKSSMSEPSRDGRPNDGESNPGVLSNSGTPSSAKRVALDAKRKRELAQQSAQASFMLRFVQGKSTGLSASKVEEDYSDTHIGSFREGDIAEKSASDDSGIQQGHFAASVTNDRDVMSVSWWLRSCMLAIPWKELDETWNGDVDCKMSSIDIRSLKAHLNYCLKRRREAQTAVKPVLRDYRRGRKEHIGDRNPCFVQKRSDCRAKCNGRAVKLFQFDENHRPAYYGTWSRRSAAVNGRRPFGRDKSLDYEYDSDEDWDDEEDGENLSDPEADDERAAEDAELRKLYGSDESDDEDFEENLDEDDGGDDSERCEDDKDTNEDCIMDAEGEFVHHSQESCAEVDVVQRKINFKCSRTEDHENSERDSFGADASKNGVTGSGLHCNDGLPGTQNQDRRQGIEVVRGGGKRNGKRRKLRTVQSVIIEGPCFGVEEKTAACHSLHQYPVTMSHENSFVEMFNPFVLDACAMAGEHLKGRPSGLKSSRATMDELARQELAVAVEKGSKYSHSRDKIILEFCQAREARGFDVPSKSEIVRTFNEMATFHKRDGDIKPCWHLNTPVSVSLAGRGDEKN